MQISDEKPRSIRFAICRKIRKPGRRNFFFFSQSDLERHSYDRLVSRQLATCVCTDKPEICWLNYSCYRTAEFPSRNFRVFSPD
ncbi:hypothetical protein PUN28_010371 [Cardiocondyla obscurior]|uniref:Uncharacterized protein n=1 Tax=Cardiocondyla obscurior TaxID=286306 RepID=A0AAW2FPZ5_9HYME